MKKVIVYAMAVMFVLSLGTVYAEAGSDNGASIANTNFDIGPVTTPASHMVKDNGMEKVNTNFDIGLVATPAAAVESVHAGGIREDGPALVWNNGVTDFSGRTYDTASR